MQITYMVCTVTTKLMSVDYSGTSSYHTLAIMVNGYVLQKKILGVCMYINYLNQH